MADELTPKMTDAIEQMKALNGKLTRYPGGYWAYKGWTRWQGKHFGTSTVEALVKRGLAEYTEWHDGRIGRFPVEVTLIVKAAAEAKASKE